MVKHSSLYTKYFFRTMAVLFIVMAVIGFGQDYRLLYKAHEQLFWFSHIHGALLTAWLIIFLIQTIAAAKNNFRFHRQLGMYAVVLGVLVWISMGIVIFHAHIGYPFHPNISWDNVLFLFLTMNLFGLFFTWGILVRKDAGAHKRLLFLATLVLIAAGFNRILLFAGVDPTIRWLPFQAFSKQSLSGIPIASALFVYHDLLLISLFVYDLILLRRIHRITLIASGCIIGVHILITVLWPFLT